MAAPNRLAGESSLYLRQHANNPVDWRPWGDEALTLAKTLDRPIFLSVGYSACHWCHVMEHESFEDADTAAAMNEHFVNIKVDREERPDLDQIYMTSLQLLTREGGGWPLSVFLTPNLTPFYAGTYFPPKDMYGRPSFRRVLLAVADSWKTKREQLESVGRQVAETLKDSLAFSPQEGELNEATLRNALATLKRNYDAKNGGFGGAPKFPHPVDLRLLLRLHHRFGDPEALSMVTHTLTMMACGGIYDQIGGGFHRYSVDEKWLVPHFEKMLYDNALLVPVYCEAAQITGDSFFKAITEETLAYITDEMSNPAGAFYSTQDADSEGEEGKFYVWSDSEIGVVLGDDAQFARRIWGVKSGGNFEGHNILCRAKSDEEDADSVGFSIEAFRHKLYDLKWRLNAARGRRIRPGRDEKILTAWNGLMIAGFAKAAGIQENASYEFAGQAAAEFLLRKLYLPDSRLLRTCGDEHPSKLAAYVEDYAYFIEGLLTQYEADFDADWIWVAIRLADIMILDYFDAENGGFFFTVKDKGDVIARTKDWHDGSTPSGNAVAATALLKLAILCDRPDYRDAAEKTLNAFRGLVNDNPAAAAQMLIALDFHLGPVREVAVIGPRDAKETIEVLAALRSTFHPRQVIAFHDPADGEPPSVIALLRGKASLSGQVTTYICRNYQCDAALVDVEATIAALNAP